MNRRNVLKSFAAITGCVLCGSAGSFASESVHWGYDGDGGPEHWSDLDPTARACSLGAQQSPIDIVGSTRSALPKVDLAWKPLTGEVINNGHTIQVNVASGGAMTIGSDSYDLVQFHFHAPSEHRVDGRSFPMEVHFVHREATSGALGVLGVFMVPGRPNPAFHAIATAMPEAAGRTAPAPAGLDLSSMLPASRRYFAYEGSLTTPPCSEIVDWRVCVDPIEVDREDMAKFTGLYAMNARPIQQRHRRFVLVSEE